MTRAGTVRVSDPVVRFGHWLLVVLFAAGFRILWGLVGTRHARFAAFLRGPRETLAYLRAFAAGKPPHYTGHNPAGGWMAVLLLAMLALTAFTGLETYGAQGHGPLAQQAAAFTPAPGDAPREHGKRRRSPRERFWKELHEAAANATLALVLLHVAGAFVASLVHGENLVKAMLTGDKPAPPPGREGR